MFIAGLVGALGLAAMADARTGELDSLSIHPAEPVTPAMLWTGMEAEVDSIWNELAPEMERQRAHYFTPTGPADRHWAERGVDMEALLNQAGGGAGGANMLYGDDADGPMLQALSADAAAELAKEWALLAERRFAVGEGAAFINMLAITPAHLLVSQEAWEKTGKGFCPKSQTPAPADHMAVYRDSRIPFDAASDPDGRREGTAFSVWTALSRAPTPRVCWIYVEIAPGIYQTRSFDTEGRPLGHMDEGASRMRIVPVADLRATLTARMDLRKGQDSASAR